jgi:MFS family permease
MITVLMNLLLFPYQQMVPVIARDILDVGPGLMGVLMSAEGIGALFGAVAIASSGNLKFQGRVYMAGSMLAMTALLLFSFSHWYALSLPLLMVMGLGAAGFGTMQATIVMLVAREEMRGRALGVTSLAIGTMPLGALMIGGVASAVSPTFAIGLNASLGLVLIALVGLLAPSLRQRIVPHEGQQAHAGQLEPRPVSTEGT